jgi:predicted enzyme involved in methoxymalonyl-ACP biosynthesis
VIGRTAEHAMLAELAARAEALGVARLRGTYVPTERNGVVRDLYETLGFEPAGDGAWEYDLAAKGPPANDFVAVDG